MINCSGVLPRRVSHRQTAKLARFGNGQFKPTKQFPILGLIWLAFIATLVLMGSHVKYEFISPLPSKPETIQNYKFEVKVVKTISLKVSHYWPALGSTNCGNFVNGECISKMANGHRWQDWVGVAIACPRELEFGTKIKIGERVWTCMDRGSRITKQGDTYWVDMLTPYSLYNYGELVVGEVIEEV